jgi:putative pyoverdin transport system ATP-binding/permease protein
MIHFPMLPLLQLLRLLRSSSRAARAPLALAVIAGLLGGAAGAAFLALINSALHSDRPLRLALGFWALCALLPACRFLSSYLLLRISEGVQFDMRLELSRRILATPLRRVEELGAPRLLAALTEDVNLIVAAFSFLPVSLLYVTILGGCLGYLGWLSVKLFAIVLGFLVLGLACYQLPMRRADRFFQLSRDAFGRQISQFRALVEGIKELKLHAPKRAVFLDEEMTEAARLRMLHRVRAMVIYTLAASWGQVVFFVIIGLTLFAFPGRLGLDSRVLVGAVLTILYMLAPLDALLGMLPTLAGGAVAIERVRSLGLSLAAAGVETGGTKPGSSQGWQRIDLEAVTYTYGDGSEEDRFTLGPIDLTLYPGERVFVAGGNGSGKTTLAKLLTGLYVPDSGTVRKDGHVVGDAEREAYRQLFSAVFYDFHLFERLMGIEAAAVDEHAQDYLRRLHLERKVRVEGGAFSTLELSQGQRKRLALLAAYLEDRPFYLFDEWAADQDPVFKEIFYRQLLPELKARGKTVIVISHDDRYYSAADRLLRLEDGKLSADRRPGADPAAEGVARSEKTSPKTG